ncbi:MAG TPA: MoxR family ATPase [Vicinamibacterales bacterium]|nr:MoxR family ATPase [Vicinamibacterales bacterium]
MNEQPATAARIERFPASIDQLQQALAAQHYIADRSIAVSAFLALKLGRPLFLEGEAGVGKTEVAKALASALDAELIRLQCYEGLDVGHAVYEWDYARQLLEIRLLEAAHAIGQPIADRSIADRAIESGDIAPARAHLFSEAFLVKRPLLRALESAEQRPTVLLIDEIDRADEEFEGYLLELLSDFQVTIPELGTIRAATPPIVILTSNRTREVHDALKRRCLYLWIGYPDFEKELRIIETRLPGASKQLAEQVTAFVQELRSVELYKVPGVSETLDWTAALVALAQDRLDPAVIDETIGILLKYQEDVQAVRGARAGEILSRALARGARQSGARTPTESRVSGG